MHGSGQGPRRSNLTASKLQTMLLLKLCLSRTVSCLLTLSALRIESKWLRLPNVRSAAKRMFPFPIVPAARRHFTAPKTARPNTGLLTSKTANDPTTSSSSTSTRKRSLIHQSGGHSPCHQTALLGSFIALSKLLSIGRPPTAMSSTSTIHPSIRMLKRHKIAWQKSNA